MADMQGPIIGSQAIAAGSISRGALRWNYAALHPDVYLPKGESRSLHINTVAAWLWTRRCGVIAGRAAAALHGVPWIDDDAPIELIARHGRRRPGVVIWEERLDDDEVVNLGGLPVTSPARTALDLARHLPRDEAVAHMDGLARVTGLTAEEIRLLQERFRRARGLQRARTAIELMDGGSKSPQATKVRLALIDAGFPAPSHQITVSDGGITTLIEMGYDAAKVGIDFGSSATHVLERMEWMIITAHAKNPLTVVYLVKAAVIERGFPLYRLQKISRS